MNTEISFGTHTPLFPKHIDTSAYMRIFEAIWKNRIAFFVVFNLIDLEHCTQLHTYTGQQKKGFKVICLLFSKTEWHILFGIF